MNPQEIIDAIFHVVKNVNLERSEEDQIPIDPNVIFMGPGAVLDSISLVSLIVDIESQISEAVGFDIFLTDDDAINQPTPPFTSPKHLTDYIYKIIQNHAL
jgi:acyl carrier protein